MALVAISLVISGAIRLSSAAAPDNWVAVSLPFAGEWSVSDIWATDPSNVYAVGGDPSHTLIFHFDGASWMLDSSVRVPGAFYAVWGSSPSDVFAVGFGSLIYHFDGVAWSSQPHPSTGHLRGVWGTGPADVYAVGDGGVVLHYDGIQWTSFSSPTGNQLEEVWAASPSCVNVVGQGGDIYQFNGTSWTTISAPAAWLTGIWGNSCTEFYAVGHNGSETAGVFYRCSATGCTPICTGTFGSRPQVPQLWSVSGTGADIVAVGAFGSIAHWDGTTCTALESGVTSFLSGIWANTSCNVYAGGAANTLLRSICSYTIDCDPGAPWRNHGHYVRCVAHEVEELVAAGILTRAEGDVIVSASAESDVGR